jgi:hypothetical protein
MIAPSRFQNPPPTPLRAALTACGQTNACEATSPQSGWGLSDHLTLTAFQTSTAVRLVAP